MHHGYRLWLLCLKIVFIVSLGTIYELMQLDLQPDTEESDELEIFSMLVKKYEDEHYPVPEPTLVEAIKYRMWSCTSFLNICFYFDCYLISTILK